MLQNDEDKDFLHYKYIFKKYLNIFAMLHCNFTKENVHIWQWIDF